MRLSTREINMQGRLSRSPMKRDWSELSYSDDAWPPLLPSFSKESVEAVDRFVQGFICKRIEFRCGQMSQAQYTSTFLPQWIGMAEHRTELMEDFFAQQGPRLSEEVFQSIFGCFERLQSALRDARQERGDSAVEQHDKKITFARPVAHRLIRRSRDRFSLRSVADPDESLDRSSSVRLSTSPRPLERVDELQDSLPRDSLSPLPHMVALGDERDVHTIVLPVEDSAGAEHFTGRASGVYYGNLFPSARTSTDSTDRGGGSAEMHVAELPATVPATEGRPSRDAESWHQTLESVYQGPTLHSVAWRRLWIQLFYYVLLPCAIALYLFGDRSRAVQWPWYE